MLHMHEPIYTTVICICYKAIAHKQTYSIIHVVYSPFNQYKSFVSFHYYSNVWEINKISVAAAIFLVKQYGSTKIACPDVVTVLSENTFGEHQPFGRGSHKELETQRGLHKLTNGTAREHLLICVGLLSNLCNFKRIVCDNGRLKVISQAQRQNPAWTQSCELHQFLIRWQCNLVGKWVLLHNHCSSLLVNWGSF